MTGQSMESGNINAVGILTRAFLFYSKLPWVLMGLFWLATAVFILTRAIEPEVHYQMAGLWMMVFFGIGNHGERSDHQEGRFHLLGRLPVSRRQMAWAKWLGLLGVTLIATAGATALLTLSFVAGNDHAFEHFGRLPAVGLIILGLHSGLWMLGEASRRLPKGLRLPVAVLGILALIAVALFGLVPLVFDISEQNDVSGITGPWGYAALTLVVAVLAKWVVEAFVRRPNLGAPDPFYELDLMISGRRRS